MNQLLVMTAQDGSSLVLGERAADRQQPAALLFEHVGRGEPRSVVGRFCPFSVIADDQRHVVFAGTALSEPSVAAVHLQFPDHSRTYPVQTFRDRPGVWMSFPEPFYDGQTVKALWLVENRVYHEDVSSPLTWEPPQMPSTHPESVRSDVVEETEDGFTVTHYAYFDTQDD